MAEKDTVDTLGIDGTYIDPLWRVNVTLTPLEQDLLRSWWVRRLGFVAHAGAAAITTTQTYSRLEHSLGVLALVVHFAPDDHAARAAALLHDVGHLPFSHTFEGVAGLDHHRLGRDRIESLDPVLERHGLSVADVLAVDAGARPSPLRAAPGRLRLDHLDSFLRSGQANGRTRTSPADLLRRLRLVDGAIDTDAAIATELVELIVGEARAQRSEPNVLACAVLRSLVTSMLERSAPAAAAAMTDDELWCTLLADPVVGAAATTLRRAPHSWTVTRAPRPDRTSEHDASDGVVVHEITRGYLDLPTVDGEPLPPPASVAALASDLPLRFDVRRVSGESTLQLAEPFDYCNPNPPSDVIT